MKKRKKANLIKVIILMLIDIIVGYLYLFEKI